MEIALEFLRVLQPRQPVGESEQKSTKKRNNRERLLSDELHIRRNARRLKLRHRGFADRDELIHQLLKHSTQFRIAGGHHLEFEPRTRTRTLGFDRRPHACSPLETAPTPPCRMPHPSPRSLRH